MPDDLEARTAAIVLLEEALKLLDSIHDRAPAALVQQAVDELVAICEQRG